VKSSSSTEFTASDGRRFAFPVGTAFLLLAGILWWRGHMTFVWVAAGLATALFLAGVALPRRLGPVYRAWMRMALAISKVTTPVFMAVVYFLVLTPFGLAMRLLGKKPIVHRVENGSFWRSAGTTPKDLRRQF
jgi:hypothetical protein